MRYPDNQLVNFLNVYPEAVVRKNLDHRRVSFLTVYPKAVGRKLHHQRVSFSTVYPKAVVRKRLDHRLVIFSTVYRKAIVRKQNPWASLSYIRHYPDRLLCPQPRLLLGISNPNPIILWLAQRLSSTLPMITMTRSPPLRQSHPRGRYRPTPIWQILKPYIRQYWKKTDTNIYSIPPMTSQPDKLRGPGPVATVLMTGSSPRKNSMPTRSIETEYCRFCYGMQDILFL